MPKGQERMCEFCCTEDYVHTVQIGLHENLRQDAKKVNGRTGEAM